MHLPFAAVRRSGELAKVCILAIPDGDVRYIKDVKLKKGKQLKTMKYV